MRQTESKIVSLKRDIQFLDVEFQTRANQHQLAALNAVEFGYVAPGASQYIEGERQLAALGVPRGPGAPRPIRMANAAPASEDVPFMAMVSPVGPRQTGQDADAASGHSAHEKTDSGNVGAADDAIGAAIAEARLGARLARFDLAGGADE